MLFARLQRWLANPLRPQARRPVRTRGWALQRLEEKTVPAIAFALGSGPGIPAEVRLFDENGNQLTAFNPYPGFTGGVNVAIGDVTGDGTPDVLTGPGF